LDTSEETAPDEDSDDLAFEEMSKQIFLPLVER
jgi:hypothetical protein